MRYLIDFNVRLFAYGLRDLWHSIRPLLNCQLCMCACDSLSLMPSEIDAIAFNFINGIVFEHMLDIILTFICVFFSCSLSLFLSSLLSTIANL